MTALEQPTAGEPLANLTQDPGFTLNYVRESPEAMADLRKALYNKFGTGSAIRDEAYRLALSAAVWRLMRYGVEDGFAAYTARDLASCSLIAEGSLIEMLARAAYTRALVDDDRDMHQLLGDLGIAHSTHAWSTSLAHAAPETALASLTEITNPEELATGRLLVARRAPELAHSDWLWAVPTSTPTIAAALAKALLQRADFAPAVSAFLAQRRDVLLCREPDVLLTLLVAQSSEHPQTVLKPFEGIYGEETVVAAAAWHLEHDEPESAYGLTAHFRPLSVHADMAYLIAALAALQRNKLDEAQRLRQLIDDRGCRAQLALRLAEHYPALIADADLLALLDGCTADEPELFYRGLLCLLKRKQLTAARHLAARRQLDFQHHPQLGPIISTVLTGKSAAAAN